MASSTRKKIVDAVKTQLGTIAISGGYNTQPRICDTYEEAFGATERFTLYVNLGDETFPEAYIANRFKVNFDVLVFGIIRRDDTGNPLIDDLDYLLQDVRNAVMAYRASFPTAANGAGFMTFGTCETDEGALSQVDRAFFVQPLSFEYNAGTTF